MFSWIKDSSWMLFTTLRSSRVLPWPAKGILQSADQNAPAQQGEKDTGWELPRSLHTPRVEEQQCVALSIAFDVGVNGVEGRRFGSTRDGTSSLSDINVGVGQHGTIRQVAEITRRIPGCTGSVASKCATYVRR
jgi:hypothetical protein